MTLIVADTPAARPPVAEVISELVREHPARAIVLSVTEEHETLSVSVNAMCHVPVAGRRQVCSETVMIESGRAGVESAAALVTGILVPDLPVVLWLRQGSLQDVAIVIPFAHKVVVDSGEWPPQRLRELARVPHVADLAWARLTAWRETIASHPQVRQAREAVLTHAEDRPRSAALYLAAWLRRALGAQLQVSFERGSLGVTMRGPEFELRLERTNSCLAARMNGVETHSAAPALTEFELMREELRLLGRDPGYDMVRTLAIELAAEIS
jgi:glucose-6-phosphate dehydrogenase assembly protein OpcA